MLWDGLLSFWSIKPQRTLWASINQKNGAQCLMYASDGYLDPPGDLWGLWEWLDGRERVGHLHLPWRGHISEARPPKKLILQILTFWDVIRLVEPLWWFMELLRMAWWLGEVWTCEPPLEGPYLGNAAPNNAGQTCVYQMSHLHEQCESIYHLYEWRDSVIWCKSM